jgi:dTDP-4-amino-4,6-dideoxygalactose transaminase
MRAALAERGVQTAVHYPVPCHRQPIFAHLGLQLPVAEAAASELLSLPLYPQLAAEDVEYVCQAVLDVLAGRRTEAPTTVRTC